MSELLDPFFLLGQLRSGLTTAMFLFLIASGLSLIFGVLKIINFAHGSLYMIGAYIAWNMTVILGRTSIGFLGAVVVASLSVAVLGGIVERLLLRYMYKRPELYQLLFTYALVLIFSDVCKYIWGTQPHSVSRPPIAGGQLRLLRGALSPLRSLHHRSRAADRVRLLGAFSTGRATAASSVPPRSIARCWERSAPTCRRSIPACSCSRRSWQGSPARS